VECSAEKPGFLGGRANGTLYLDYLAWDGAPDVTWTRPAHNGTLWRRAWVNGVDEFPSWGEPYRLIQNEGRGLLIQGTREWGDYRVSADVTPHMVQAAGVAVRVQGMRRYYALLLCRQGQARLVKALDGDAVLAEADFRWEFGETHDLSLEVVTADRGAVHLQGWIDGQLVCEVTDAARPLTGGAVALVCEEGRTATTVVRVQPAT